MKKRLIVAIDGLLKEKSRDLVRELAREDILAGVKFEDLAVLMGVRGIRDLMEGIDIPVFMDLKIYSKTETCRLIAKHVASEVPNLWGVTVHAQAGGDAIEAVAKEMNLIGAHTLSITVLTSHSVKDLRETNRHLPRHADERLIMETEVYTRALCALKRGATGIICAGEDLKIHIPHDGSFIRVVPGVRILDQDQPMGQKRIASPEEAVEHGADFVVVGSPITGASDPIEAAHDYHARLN